MHDHAIRGKRFCPLMKEWCNQGWTKSMGTDDEGMPKPGICASWQPVTLVNNDTNNTEEIYDCSQFGWMPDLLTELSGRIVQVTASVDKTATEVAKHHITQVKMASPAQKRQLLLSDPYKKNFPKPEYLEHNTNGSTKNEELNK